MFTIYIYIFRPGLLSTFVREHFCSGTSHWRGAEVIRALRKRDCVLKPTQSIFINLLPQPQWIVQRNNWKDMTWLSHMWPDVSCGFLRMMDTYTTQQKSLHRYDRLSPDHTLLKSYRKLIVARGERITV